MRDSKCIFLRSLALVIAVNLAACTTATVKVPQATGGSRADATVDMQFEYGVSEEPVINWDEANATARHRCEAWGYSDAEKFGGEKNQCLRFEQYGNCIRMAVTMTYQCTGTGAPKS